MNVRDIMIKNVATCGADASLESVAMQMWNEDCGSIPVVDDKCHPVGILTDRDIAMGSAMNHRALWDMRAGEVTGSRPLYTCRADEDVHVALRTMSTKHVRRLPVVDAQGCLEGIVSIDDIVALARPNSGSRRGQEISYDEAMEVLRSVSKHHH